MVKTFFMGTFTNWEDCVKETERYKERLRTFEEITCKRRDLDTSKEGYIGVTAR